MPEKSKKVIRAEANQRQRAVRERRRAAGLVQLEVWVLPEDVDKVKKLRDKAVAAIS